MDVKRLRGDPTALTELHFSREIQAAPIESAHEAIAAAAQAHKFDSVKQYLLSKAVSSEPSFVALRPWLSDETRVSARALGIALKRASFIGHLELVEFLKSTHKISMQAIGKALEEAAGNCNLEIMKALISGATIPRENINHILITAVSLGHIEPIRLIKNMGISFQQSKIADAIQIAARHGFIEIVRILVPDLNERVSEAIGVGLAEACIKGNVPLVKLFLEDRRFIQEKSLAIAVHMAAMHGHVEIMKSLLFFDATLPRESVERALEVTIEKNHHELAQVCKDFITIRFDTNLSNGLKAASRQGWSTVVQTFLALGPISAVLKDECLRVARDSVTLDILERAQLIPTESRSSDASWSLEIKIHDIQQQPEKVLLYLFHEGFPSGIVLKDYPKIIDDEAMVKQFVSMLIESLIHRRVFKRTDSGLIYASDVYDSKLAIVLGRLYADIDLMNTDREDPILIGPLLHSRYFELVNLSVSKQDVIEKKVHAARLISEIDPNYSIVFRLLTDPSESNKTLMREIFYCAVGDEMQDATTIVNSILRSARAFYRGLKARFIEKISFDPLQSMIAVQGERLSRELVLRALKFLDETPDMSEKYFWLIEKIIDSDEIELTKLVYCITGKKTLSFGDKIFVQRSEVPDQFSFISCRNTLVLPFAPMSKKMFFVSLDACSNLDFNTD